MSNIKQLTDKQGNSVYPITAAEAVVIGNTTINNEIDNINSILDSVQDRLNSGTGGSGSTVSTGTNILGSSASSVANSTSATTNESTYLNHVVNGQVVSSLSIHGGNGSTVSAQNGNLTINATDTKNTVGATVDNSTSNKYLPITLGTGNSSQSYVYKNCKIIGGTTDLIQFGGTGGTTDGADRDVNLRVNGYVSCDSLLCSYGTIKCQNLECTNGIIADKFNTTTAIGSTSNPIYINAQGLPTPCTSIIANSANKISTTKNTVTAPENSSSVTGLYLIGAKTLNDTDSNTLQTLNVHIAHISNNNYTGNYLMCGCAYSENSNIAKSSDVSTKSVITNTSTTNANYFLNFTEDYQLNRGIRASSSLKYNPSTNTLLVGTTTSADSAADSKVQAKTFESTTIGGSVQRANIKTQGSYTEAAPIITIQTADGRIYGFFPYGSSNMSVGDIKDCRIKRLK